MEANLRDTLSARVREIPCPYPNLNEFRHGFECALPRAAQLIAESPELAEVEAKIVELNQEVEVWKKNRELARKSAKEELDQQKEYSDDLYAELTQLRAEVVGLKKLLERFADGPRHTHVAGEEDRDKCRKCGHDVRALIHYRVGESVETDVAAARAALGEGERNGS